MKGQLHRGAVQALEWLAGGEAEGRPAWVQPGGRGWSGGAAHVVRVLRCAESEPFESVREGGDLTCARCRRAGGVPHEVFPFTETAST